MMICVLLMVSIAVKGYRDHCGSPHMSLLPSRVNTDLK